MAWKYNDRDYEKHPEGTPNDIPRIKPLDVIALEPLTDDFERLQKLFRILRAHPNVPPHRKLLYCYQIASKHAAEE